VLLLLLLEIRFFIDFLCRPSLPFKRLLFT